MKKIIAALLSLSVAATPLLAAEAFAKELPGSEVTILSEVQDEAEEISEKTTEYNDEMMKTLPVENSDKTAKAMSTVQSVGTGSVPGSYSVSVASVSSGFTIQANINSAYTKAPYYYIFGKLFVDGVEVKDFTYETSIPKQTVSLDKFGIGYHSVFLQVYNSTTGELVDLYYKDYVAKTLKDKPSYKGVYDVYSKYFNVYPYTAAFVNTSHPLYVEYSRTGKTWKCYGPMNMNAIKLGYEQGYKIPGLKPGKKYKIRLRYGISATYTQLEFPNGSKVGSGKSHMFYGPVLYAGTYKMGKAKAPAIKKIKVKAVNVKYHKHKVAGHYEWTGYSYIWIGPYTEKYYTCKYRVSVRLKKRPNAAGLWINGKYVKGNKTKYITTFTPYPNYFVKRPPKGLKKYKVQIRSYQSKKYNGFSPSRKTSRKIVR